MHAMSAMRELIMYITMSIYTDVYVIGICLSLCSWVCIVLYLAMESLTFLDD